ncbi:flagellar basal-body MS-ring/collar protein FliF [Mesobaculum littorinae]|nr:flagellar basal-body MS-ring/collar protein FliF [Mesobaculum littorinae]
MMWSRLSPRRKLIAILATVAMFAAILGVSRLATSTSMTLLYAGLENDAAGEVVSALEARGVPYEVRGSSIFVDSTSRDQLRMTLASEGLPANSTQGYELLDSLSGFGTTSQMFDAAYWRAKEGELARTITASPAIQAARVHIASQGGRPFQRELAPTASVTITTAAGGIGAAHARALRYMVASAVAGLAPETVSVIDAKGGAILAAEDDGTAPGMAEDRAELLKRNVERLLEARVGYGNAVVEVNVDTATEREQIVERRIDPESRVAISSETEESANTSRDSGGAPVTVASNLPDGDAAGGDRDSQSENSETRERVNYEVSEIQREVLRTPGAVRRISVAVLVDGLRNVTDAGETIWTPRPEEEIAALRELVASAVGYDAERGDSLTIKSMEFEPLPGDGTDAAGLLPAGAPIDTMRLAQLGIMGLTALLLGLFVIRPILTASGLKAIPAEGDPAALPGASPAAEDNSGGLTGEIAEGELPGGLQIVSAFDDMDDDDFGLPAPPAADPVERLRNLIEERQTESLEILKSWMQDDGEKA